MTTGDGAPDDPVDVSAIADAVPRPEPRSRYGNPDSYVVLGKRYHVLSSSRGYRARGIASWYGTKFHGRRTSSGEPYDMLAMTAAHRTLPLPTYLRVTNRLNGRSVVVRVNDRGPFHDDRLIDLSYAAAVKLDLHHSGTAPVEIRALEPAASPAVAGGSIKTGGGAFLQVGAFRDPDNARRLQRRLAELDAGPVRLRPASVGGARLVRVQVGPFPSAQAAAEAIRRIRALGIANPRLIGAGRLQRAAVIQ